MREFRCRNDFYDTPIVSRDLRTIKVLIRSFLFSFKKFMAEQRRVSSNTINRKIGSKESLYRTLSNVYFLPAQTAHAITKDYLKKVLDLSNERIFRIKHSQIRLRATIYQRIPKEGLHTLVNNEVIRRRLEIGFDEDMRADYNWYAQVYLAFFPEDPHCIGKQPPEEERAQSFPVDPEVKKIKRQFLFNFKNG